MDEKNPFDVPKNKAEWIPTFRIPSHVDHAISVQGIEVAEDVIHEVIPTKEVEEMIDHELEEEVNDLKDKTKLKK